MVIDTSALIAIMCGESSAPRLVAAIDQSTVRLISAASIVEASLALLARFGEVGEVQLDAMLNALQVEVIAVDSDQAAIARDAARTFGRGRHPAGLNFGDLFSYALSLATGEPLLFVGEDFAKTDVLVAAW